RSDTPTPSWAKPTASTKRGQTHRYRRGIPLGHPAWNAVRPTLREHLRLIGGFLAAGAFRGFRLGFALGGGAAAQALLLGALTVEPQQAGEDLIAEVVGPAVTPRLLAATASPGLFPVFILLLV